MAQRGVFADGKGGLSGVALLEIKEITKRFGGLTALNQVSFDINPGEIMGLIGPNGSGKSTLINVITGTYKPTGGRIVFKGRDVTGLKPHVTARAGIGRSFQLSALFKEFSVLDTMRLAFHLQSGVGFCGAALNTSATVVKERETDQKAMAFLEFLGIGHAKDELTKNLPHGLERLLGVGMAMATGAEMLLLDEPVTGMNPTETDEMMQMIRGIRDRGTTILVVEHNMRVIMGLCDRIAAINFGRKIAEGTPEHVRENKEVIEAYLGTEEETAA